jgi:hypothetical protein
MINEITTKKKPREMKNGGNRSKGAFVRVRNMARSNESWASNACR